MPSQQDRESGLWRQTRFETRFRPFAITHLPTLGTGRYHKSDGHDGGTYLRAKSHSLPRVVFPDAEADHARRDGGDGRTMYRAALLCHMGIMFISRKCTRRRLTSFWNPADRRHPCPDRAHQGLVLGSSVLSTPIGGQRAFGQSGELCFGLLSAIRSKDRWKCRRVSVVLEVLILVLQVSAGV